MYGSAKRFLQNGFRTIHDPVGCRQFPSRNLLLTLPYSLYTIGEYSGGHDWPDFGGEAIWDFFDSLLLAIPSPTPGTGEPPPMSGFASIKVNYPSDFIGTADKIYLGLYPSGTSLPLTGSPDKILTLQGFAVGEYVPGQVKEYNLVPINMSGVEPGNYTLVILVYVYFPEEGEDPHDPVPVSGQDYIGLQEISVDSSIIDIEAPLELELMIY